VVAPAAIERLGRLAQRATVRVAVDDAGNVAELAAAARRHGVTLGVLVEIDAGMGRCGSRPGQPAVDLALVAAQAAGLRFVGLHAYEGHVVKHPDWAVRRTETEKMLALTMETQAAIERAGLPVAVVTCGGTG